MADVLRSISTRTTDQRTKARKGQAKNNAGGYVFKITPRQQLRRFLILGVEGGTYYQKSDDIAADNAKVVFKLAISDPTLLVDEILDVGLNGLAARPNPVLFALAVATAPQHNKNVEERTRAFNNLSGIARTSTQLFIFLNYAQQFRGWGPALREAVSNWYLNKTASNAAYQIVKYRQREGWTHRDVLRQAHPKVVGEDVSAFKSLFDYACGRDADLSDPALRIVEGYEKAKTASATESAKLVQDYGLSWEMLNDRALDSKEVWQALIDNGMPYTALMRQLPRLTRLGLAEGRTGNQIAKRLMDEAVISKSHVHPAAILFALKTYSSGRGFRGSQVWRPSSKVSNALDSAFYAAFKNVQPTEKAHMLALDVSGSMSATIMNSNLSAREASVAMAMITAAVEKDCEIVGFTGNLRTLDVSPRRRLDDNVSAVCRLPFGSTDCAQPMLHAIKNKLEIEQFVVYTDSETWSGSVQPYQALRRYREQSGVDAKLVVVGMTATRFSIADPSDAGMLDVVGFDASAPAVISEFARGVV